MAVSDGGEVRKKKIISLMENPSYVPMREKELACIMQVRAEERPELKRLLEELLEEGKIRMNRRGRYLRPEETLFTGVFTAHPKGFGFVEAEGNSESFYIPEEGVNGAWHQDTVEVRILPGRSGQRREAEVVRIIARGMSQVVGTWESRGGFGFVVPDSNRVLVDVFVPQEHSKKAVDGAKVVAEITDYGQGRPGKSPEGKIVEILGHPDDPGVDILSVVREFGLPEVFPEKVEKQAARCQEQVSEADRAGRQDLRDLLMVTIDGEDAKDLDDAVSLYQEGENYCLGVHIADVANYVQENSALDWEALNRGTSVYLVDRVIPMLPRALSNGICSLNAGEDRLALSCLMTVSPKGEVVDYSLAETVIHVDRRMTYTSVAKILEGDEEECACYEDVVPMLRKMAELSAIVRERRHRRGAVEFDFPESKITLDGQGRPVDIRPYERNAATRLIEDFMLLANETVAQHFYWMQVPFLYRSHESPDPDKVHSLGIFVRNFGYSIKFGQGQEEIHPKEFQKLLEKAEGTLEEPLIHRMTLRSMRQACYTTQCTGHFGLASRFYCHFTSPIRRYPDLQIHRIIKDQIRGRLDEGRLTHYAELLSDVAKQTSRTERRADEAEREVDKLKKAEYMEGKIGEVFDGVISAITGWGLYVELQSTVEGLVHVTRLGDDFFFYDEEACEMQGTHTGVTYKLGQRLQVKVKFADRFTKTIDFELAEGDVEEG